MKALQGRWRAGVLEAAAAGNSDPNKYVSRRRQDRTKAFCSSSPGITAAVSDPIANLPLVQSYHPTTFLERGVAVPFTTPMLAGTRARPAERGGPELIVPNPSGGRGVYILAWADLRALCQPTVHDRRLNEKAAALIAVSPSSIRAVGRQVAAEGLAGPAAREAAIGAVEADRQDLLTTNYLLLMLMVKQAGRGPGADGGGNQDADVAQRARQAVVLTAARLGLPADAVAASLEALAGLFGCIGVPGAAAECRIPRLLRTLRHVRDEVGAWRGERGEGSSTFCAEMVVAAADLTLICAEHTLGEALALTSDITALLRGWHAAPGKIAGAATRPEWLLDGWEQICALWKDAAGQTGRLSALVEMAQLVPILPNETADWIGRVVDQKKIANYRRRVRLNEDWLTGATVFSLIARNERLRAMAL
jgi:hypothetical protein